MSKTTVTADPFRLIHGRDITLGGRRKRSVCGAASTQLLTKRSKQKRGRARKARPRRIDAVMATGQRDGLPLFDELSALDQQVHALFAELWRQRNSRARRPKIVRAV